MLRIPVYVINALYLWPITVWTYLRYGRPVVPQRGEKTPSHCAHHPSRASADGETAELAHSKEPSNLAPEGQMGGHHDEGGHHYGSGERPMFATITIAVCHCGAGCVLGDVIGEWLVYGTGVAINGRMLWAEYLIGG